MLKGIPDTFLPLKYTDGEGPIIVAVEKSAIHYDPPGTAPETEAEWNAVTNSIGETLKSLVFELLPRHDIMRSNESGVRWRHLDLNAAMLAERPRAPLVDKSPLRQAWQRPPLVLPCRQL
jgi:hypothetical protein